MTDAAAPPWAQDAGQHKEPEPTAPAPVMLTDAAVTSTLSGQPVLSGGVAGEAGYGVVTPTKSPWQRGTYWRFVGMACALQLLLAVLLLSATLSYMNTEEIWSNEEVVVEVVNGKGEVRMNPDGDLRLSSIWKPYMSTMPAQTNGIRTKCGWITATLPATTTGTTGATMATRRGTLNRPVTS